MWIFCFPNLLINILTNLKVDEKSELQKSFQSLNKQLEKRKTEAFRAQNCNQVGWSSILYEFI